MILLNEKTIIQSNHLNTSNILNYLTNNDNLVTVIITISPQ